MMQTRFDPEKWTGVRPEIEFDIQSIEKNFGLRIAGDKIKTPVHYFDREAVLLHMKKQFDLGPPQWRDYVLWGKGEPSSPDQIKFGGRPYRPPGEKWPCDKAGRPLSFVCQFNFSATEGHQYEKELMLVFGRVRRPYVCEFYVEWWSPASGDRCVPFEVPEGITWPPQCFYGEVVSVEIFPEWHKHVALRDEDRRKAVTFETYLRSECVPSRSSMVFGCGADGSGLGPDKLVAALSNLNPKGVTEGAWLNADEPELGFMYQKHDATNMDLLSWVIAESAYQDTLPGKWFENLYSGLGVLEVKGKEGTWKIRNPRTLRFEEFAPHSAVHLTDSYRREVKNEARGISPEEAEEKIRSFHAWMDSMDFSGFQWPPVLRRVNPDEHSARPSTEEH